MKSKTEELITKLSQKVAEISETPTSERDKRKAEYKGTKFFLALATNLSNCRSVAHWFNEIRPYRNSINNNLLNTIPEDQPEFRQLIENSIALAKSLDTGGTFPEWTQEMSELEGQIRVQFTNFRPEIEPKPWELQNSLGESVIRRGLGLKVEGKYEFYIGNAGKHIQIQSKDTPPDGIIKFFISQFYHEDVMQTTKVRTRHVDTNFMSAMKVMGTEDAGSALQEAMASSEGTPRESMIATLYLVHRNAQKALESDSTNPDFSRCILPILMLKETARLLIDDKLPKAIGDNETDDMHQIIEHCGVRDTLNEPRAAFGYYTPYAFAILHKNDDAKNLLQPTANQKTKQEGERIGEKMNGNVNILALDEQLTQQYTEQRPSIKKMEKLVKKGANPILLLNYQLVHELGKKVPDKGEIEQFLRKGADVNCAMPYMDGSERKVTTPSQTLENNSKIGERAKPMLKDLLNQEIEKGRGRSSSESSEVSR